jgi:hypothetical protein
MVWQYGRVSRLSRDSPENSKRRMQCVDCRCIDASMLAQWEPCHRKRFGTRESDRSGTAWNANTGTRGKIFSL